MLKRLCTWKCPRSYLSCVVVQQLIQRRDIYYSWGFCALKFILSVHKALDQHDYWTMSLSFWWPTSQGLAPEWGIIQVTLRSDLPSSRTAFKGCPSKLPSSERVASPWIRYQPMCCAHRQKQPYTELNVESPMYRSSKVFGQGEEVGASGENLCKHGEDM